MRLRTRVLILSFLAVVCLPVSGRAQEESAGGAPKIQINLFGFPDQVPAGEAAEGTVRLKNLTDQEVPFKLRTYIETPIGLTVAQYPKASGTLAPREQREIPWAIGVSRRAEVGSTVRVQIGATAPRRTLYITATEFVVLSPRDDGPGGTE